MRPASGHVRDVRLMETAIILLAAACFILSGALTWLWLSGRAETRAEYRRELARVSGLR